MTDTLTGQTIGKYQIQAKIGRGGMAEVYKGYQENLDRYVAIKLMHTFLVSEKDFLQRFKREAKAMAALRHPNIVRVYDFDAYTEDTYYLVMEYVGGGTLKEKLEALAANGERLAIDKSVQLAMQVANALDYAHGRGMVHRDIKPANIMLDESGRAILTDFGIVKLVGGQSMAYTATGALIGTPSYMSPEQALGKPGDERCDLYSLGVLLFQMVTGQLPFAADTPLAIVMKHVNEPAPLPMTFNPDIPLQLQEVILKALAKEPEDRYQTAAEMATALRTVNLSPIPGAATAVIATPGQVTAPGSTLPASTIAAPDIVDTAPIQTEVIAPIPEKRRSPWAILGPILAVLLIIGAVATAFLLIRDTGREPTEVAVVVPGPTDTGAPVPTETGKPTATIPPEDTPDVVATAIAGVNQTAAAQVTPTATGTPTPTTTPTATATVDATAEFLASCTFGVELVNAFTYQNPQFKSAPIGATFTMNWVLKNSGTCPWPADFQWAYVEGNEFGYDDPPLSLENDVAGDEEITLTATFIAPNSVGDYESTWQLVNVDGEPIGSPLTFEITTYIPATPTPRPTNTPEATPTSEVTELDWIFVVGSCEYVGSDWRCQVTITPYGGGGGPYTVWVFDQPGGLATEYRGPGPFTYFAKARRCAAYNQEVKVQDDATGTSFSEPMYIAPDDYFEGGCVKP